jgi:hypothetical protein
MFVDVLKQQAKKKWGGGGVQLRLRARVTTALDGCD